MFMVREQYDVVASNTKGQGGASLEQGPLERDVATIADEGVHRQAGRQSDRRAGGRAAGESTGPVCVSDCARVLSKGENGWRQFSLIKPSLALRKDSSLKFYQVNSIQRADDAAPTCREKKFKVLRVWPECWRSPPSLSARFRSGHCCCWCASPAATSP